MSTTNITQYRFIEFLHHINLSGLANKYVKIEDTKPMIHNYYKC